MLTIESLPHEIVGHICDLLSASDCPFSVGHLAGTSKQLYQVAGSRRFAEIFLTFRTRKQFKAAVDRWFEILDRNAAFTAVRQLKVRGRLPGQHNPDSDGGLWDGVVDVARWIPEDALTCVDSYYCSMTWENKVDVEHESLSALPALVRQLSGLRDLYWSCGILLPPSLLEVLHQEPSLTHCRLHMMAFKLPSLHQHAHQLHDIDPYDWQLATSPHLHTVAVPVSLYDGYGHGEYNGEAVRELVKLVPSLTHVHIITRKPGYGCHTLALLKRGRPIWPGFFSNAQQQALPSLPASRIGNLASLSLKTTKNIEEIADWDPAQDVNEFLTWQRYTAFSALRTLQLWKVSRPVLLAAAGCQFPALRALSIDPLFQWDAGEAGQSAQKLGAQAAASFFQSLQPDTLQKVHLSTGTIGSMHPGPAIAAIIHHHGAALHTLSLTDAGEDFIEIHPDADPITLAQIKQIQASCPQLRDLRVPVRRHKGNLDEVGLYQAIGQFSQLRDLTMRLDCITRRPDVLDLETFMQNLEYDVLDPEPYEPDPEPPVPDPEEIRDWMINAAVDSRLVEEIFAVVAQESAPLQRLHVVPVNNANDPLNYVLDEIGRRWHCLRLFPDGSSGLELRTQEVVARYWKNLRGNAPFPSTSADESIFRSLWPPRKNGSWEFDWHSFPLERPESGCVA